jgi:hypothetical protein
LVAPVVRASAPAGASVGVPAATLVVGVFGFAAGFFAGAFFAGAGRAAFAMTGTLRECVATVICECSAPQL